MSDEFNQSPLDFRRVDIPAFIRRLVRRYETDGIGEWRYAAEVIEQQDAELSSLRARVAELEAAPSINIAWIGGNCPVQAEGTVGGKPFYFRARGDAWSFGVGAEPVGSPDWEITAPFGEDFDAGWMDVEQARSIVLAAAALYSVAQMPSADTPKVTP